MDDRRGVTVFVFFGFGFFGFPLREIFRFRFFRFRFSENVGFFGFGFGFSKKKQALFETKTIATPRPRKFCSATKHDVMMMSRPQFDKTPKFGYSIDKNRPKSGSEIFKSKKP